MEFCIVSSYFPAKNITSYKISYEVKAPQLMYTKININNKIV